MAPVTNWIKSSSNDSPLVRVKGSCSIVNETWRVFWGDRCANDLQITRTRSPGFTLTRKLLRRVTGSFPARGEERDTVGDLSVLPVRK